jgi:6-phosphogluconolactonase
MAKNPFRSAGLPVFRYVAAAAALISIISCGSMRKPDTGRAGAAAFYVGTYTSKESRGIYRYVLKNDGRIERVGLASFSDNPTFLARSKDMKYVLAANEIRNEEGVGTVESFQVEGDSLIFLSRSSSGGANPCHLTATPSGFVLVANYASGSVGLVRLDKDGGLSELLDVRQHYGQGVTERQKGPHAHCTRLDPVSGRIIAADLGTDELWFYGLDTADCKFDTSGQVTLRMAPGAGPRHLVFHPNSKWMYVVNELGNTVTLLVRSEDGGFEPGASWSTLPGDYREENFCADIHLSSEGKFLYASNRGHNSIVIFGVDPSDGSLTLIGHEPTRGEWPRNFSLSPDENFLIVANQHSDNIVSFRRDRASGLLEYMAEAEAPTPVCILF